MVFPIMHIPPFPHQKNKNAAATSSGMALTLNANIKFQHLQCLPR
jgi:hypothetical protein